LVLKDYTGQFRRMPIKVVNPITRSAAVAQIGRENREMIGIPLGIPNSFALLSLPAC
jgi:hypothetical protein